jgi:hypothetical protein
MEPYVAGGKVAGCIWYIAGRGYCICGAGDTVLPVHPCSLRGTLDPEDKVVQHELAGLQAGAAVYQAMVKSRGGYSDPGLNEGNADALANFMTRESLIARGFFLNCSSGIRDSQNSLIYPDDVIGQDEYHAGQVIAGFHWDTSQGFRALYGDDAGTTASAERWHFGRKLIMPKTQPAQVIATFIADDDDGNLQNGTPNFAILCQAAMNHNFICPRDVFVDFSYTGPEDGSFSRPFNTLAEGVAAVISGGVISIKTSTGYESATISKPMTIRTCGGSAVIVGQ